MGDKKALILCGGLQSSGSTLVSWCFLQRPDMDGVLDADNDLLPQIDPAIGQPLVWYKTTICCFQLTELVAHYEDSGWTVRPLLVVRDLRSVWASLQRKPYARNGITAEDPPLRMRVRRYVDDWQRFRERNWPILRYESLVTEPETTLREACTQLGLPWNEAMIHWPKSPEEIADTKWGNATFLNTRTANLMESLARYKQRGEIGSIASSDLEWLETEFSDFNIENRYPVHIESADNLAHAIQASAPRFEVTRRYEWETKRKPFRSLLASLGIPYRKLIERRSIKKAT